MSEQGTSSRSRADAFKALAHETPDLSYGAKVLWHVIYHHADSKTGEAFPGYRAIAREMGCHMASIEGWLEELTEAKWIAFKVAPSEKHKRGYRHVYLVLDGQGKSLFKSVPENPNTVSGEVSRKIRTLRAKRKPNTPFGKTEHSVPENPNVTNSLPKGRSESSCAGSADGDQTTDPPLGAPLAPASRAADAAARRNHPAFVPGNHLDEEGWND